MKQKGHKIFEILTHLDSEEFRVFKNYVVAFTNSGSDLSELISYLFANKKMLKSENVSGQLKDHLFPSQTQKNYSNLISKLYLLFQDWIVSYDLNNSKYDKELALVKSFNRRGIYSEADRIAKKLELKIDSNLKYEIDQSRINFLLKDYQYFSDNPIKYREGSSILESVTVSFNNYYREQTHLYNAEMFNWGRIRKYDYSEIIDSNLKRVDGISHSKVSKVTEALQNLMDNYDTQAFEYITDILLDNQLEEGTNLHAMSCAYAIAACLYLIRNKSINDLELLVKLYEYGLESKGIIKEGKLPITRFHNIVASIAVVNTYSTVDDFIEKWISMVNAKYPKSTLQIAKAQNCFYHKKYAEIINYTRFSKFEDIVQKIRALRYELISLYEGGDYDMLYNSLSNFLRMLKRNKNSIVKLNYEICINFHKILNMLMRNDKESVSLMLKMDEPLIYRSWIESKIKDRMNQ